MQVFFTEICFTYLEFIFFLLGITDKAPLAGHNFNLAT